MIDYAEEHLGQGPSNSVRGMETFHISERCANGPESVFDHRPLVGGQRRDQILLSASEFPPGKKPPLQAAVQVLVY